MSYYAKLLENVGCRIDVGAIPGYIEKRRNAERLRFRLRRTNTWFCRLLLFPARRRWGLELDEIVLWQQRVVLSALLDQSGQDNG